MQAHLRQHETQADLSDLYRRRTRVLSLIQSLESYQRVLAQCSLARAQQTLRAVTNGKIDAK